MEKLLKKLSDRQIEKACKLLNTVHSANGFAILGVACLFLGALATGGAMAIGVVKFAYPLWTYFAGLGGIAAAGGAVYGNGLLLNKIATDLRYEQSTRNTANGVTRSPPWPDIEEPKKQEPEPEPKKDFDAAAAIRSSENIQDTGQITTHDRRKLPGTSI